MNGAQITIIVLMALEVGFSIAKDGEPRTGTYSMWYAIIAWGLVAAVLWWVGFWK